MTESDETSSNGDTSRLGDQPETPDEETYAEMVGSENFSKKSYEMAVDLGYWG